MAIAPTVTAKGQITLRREVLARLGVRPGDKLDVDLLANKRIQLRSRRGTSAGEAFGMLARPETPRLSIEEMNEIATTGWAGEP